MKKTLCLLLVAFLNISLYGWGKREADYVLETKRAQKIQELQKIGKESETVRQKIDTKRATIEKIDTRLEKKRNKQETIADTILGPSEQTLLKEREKLQRSISDDEKKLNDLSKRRNNVRTEVDRLGEELKDKGYELTENGPVLKK